VTGKEMTTEYVQRLRIYPHALRARNAYYSPERKALLLGYFSTADSSAEGLMEGSVVFTAVSHDVIAHETTHACLTMLGEWPVWLQEGLAQKLSGEALAPAVRRFPMTDNSAKPSGSGPVFFLSYARPSATEPGRDTIRFVPSPRPGSVVTARFAPTLGRLRSGRRVAPATFAAPLPTG